MALPQLALGQVVPARYTLERELGRGGMATVYLAHDTEHASPVALKLLRPEVAAALGTERFLREIRLTAKLHHPHILGLLDSGEVEGSLYYTMPYVRGEPLRARIERERQLPIAEALRIASEVAAALAYAHGEGVVHRDIKPENILLESREGGDRALVADFGIAQALSTAGGERLTATGLAIGTPAYMSPEQASGRPVDGRSDLYSLGCVVYEMLGGEPPYTGPTGQAIIAKRFREPIPHLRTLRAEVPDSVEHTVTRALAKSPADRFATAAQLAAALAPGAIPPTVRLPRWRARRTALLLGALVVVASAVGGAALLRDRRAAGPPMVAAGTRRIVVAVFQNRTGDSSLEPLGDIVADYLARGLAENRSVEVIDARIGRLADARSRDLAGARVLAQRLGAGGVLWGSYARRGDSLEFQAQWTDAATGKPLGAIPLAAGPASRPTQGIEALRQRVMVTLANRLDTGFSSQFEAADAVSPASYEAYREFMAAEAIASTDICPPGRDCPAEAFVHWRRAHALDSNFVSPLVSIAALSFFTGACERTDSTAEVLRPLRKRLSPFESRYLDWLVASCHGEPAGVLETSRQVMLAAPRIDLFAFRYGAVLWRSGFLRQAIAVTQARDRGRTEHEFDYWANLVHSHHLLGEHQRELELARQARQAFPGELNVLRWEAHALLALGRLTEMNGVVEEMARVHLEAAQGTPLSGHLHSLGRDLQAHGYDAEARAVFERGIRWHHSIINARSAYEERDLRSILALLLYDLERWDEARPIVQRLAAETPDDIDVQALVGAVAAHRGDLREVGRIDRWLAARTSRYLRGEHTFGRARLAAILGRRDQAMQLFRQALDQGYNLRQGPYGVFHPDPDFASLRGDPLFQQLTQPRD